MPPSQVSYLKTALPSIAVVGGGYWGKNLVRNFSTLGTLSIICESDPARLQSFGGMYPEAQLTVNYADVLKDNSIHGVVISTPAETHETLVKDALLAGKDVLVEKPLCLSVKKGESLVSLARKEDRILMVGHLLWYHPAVLRLRDLIQCGELGRIQYIYSNRLNLGKIRREENILWSFAPHDLSIILGLLEETPDSVQAQGGNFLHQQIADVTVTLLSFPSGVKAHTFVSWLHPFKEQKLVVVGDRKMAVFDDLEPQNKLVLFPHTIDWKEHLPIPNKADAQPVSYEWVEPLKAECQHFLECLQTRKPPRTDGEEGLRVLRVLQQCQNALEKRQQIHFSESPSPKNSYFVHESAFVDTGVEIGSGSSIWHFSHLLTGSQIGENCKIGQNVVIGPKVKIGSGVKIQNNVSIYEGVTLEDFVFCGPSMVFTNVFNPRSEIPRMQELRTTLVKQGATLGANCTILCGLTIGRYAFVGAGSVVTKDVPDFALVYGSPAQVRDWVCVCAKTLQWENGNTLCSCGKQFELLENGLCFLKEN